MHFTTNKTSQHEIDTIFEEIANGRWNLLTDREFKKLVENINYKFQGEDLILRTLSKKELLQILTSNNLYRASVGYLEFLISNPQKFLEI